MHNLDQTTVSVGLILCDALPESGAAVRDLVASVADQDHAPIEVIIADDRGPTTTLASDVSAGSLPIRHLPATYDNRAAMYDAIVQQATGDFLLLVYLESGGVTLRRSAIRTMLMAATRRADSRDDAAGMVYADYERRDDAGTTTDVHLLPWHAGRLRDDVDFGAAILYRTDLVRAVGSFNTDFAHAYRYDLRLRVSERTAPLLIANRFAGSLYTVAATAAGHDVFAYLRGNRAAQIEAERACTAHLQRTGTYLSPGAHVRAVSYDAAELAPFDDCIASIVIPVNRRPEFIGRAIESVQAQTETRVEVIVVVNGGPSDPTAAEVRRYMAGGDKHQAAAPPVKLMVVDVNNLGLCLNSGIAAARGKYYVQLDSDDRLKPDAVARLLAVFDADPTVGMVVGSYEVWTLNDATGELTRNADIPVVKHEEWTADNGRNNLLRINGAGAPRAAHIKVIREAGWFGVNDTAHCRNYGEDYDLVLRISERHTIGRVWEPIYEVIRHGGGTDHAIDAATVDRNNDAKDEMRREALERRRGLNSSTRQADEHGA